MNKSTVHYIEILLKPSSSGDLIRKKTKTLTFCMQKFQEDELSS